MASQHAPPYVFCLCFDVLMFDSVLIMEINELELELKRGK